MSDSNRVALRATKEVTLGVLPLTPTLQTLAITGAPDLAFQPETTVSEIIRSDRQIADLPLVNAAAGGSVPSELAFDVHDLLIEGALFDTFQQRYNRENIQGLAAQITLVDGTLEEVTVTDEGTAPVVDDIVRHEGFLQAANNGFFTVASVTANTAYVVNEDLVDETPTDGAEVHVVGRRGAAADLTLTVTGSTAVLGSTILDFTTLDLADGDWIKLAGFVATPANNDWYRIAFNGISANALSLDVIPAGAATESPAGAVDVYMGERITNGLLLQTYSLEEEFQATNPLTYQYFRGMGVDGWTVTAEPAAIATTSFTFNGLNAVFSDTNNPTGEFPVDGAGRAAGAVSLPVPPLNVLNTSSNVGRIARDGVAITGQNFVLQSSIEIANNLRQNLAVGTLGAARLGVGSVDVTGTLNTYFDDATIAQQVIDNDRTSFDQRFEDDAGHVQLYDLPRMKYSEGAPSVPGRNQDVTLELSFQAFRHEDLGYTIKVMRFHGFQ